MKAQKFIFISCIMLFFLFLIFSGCARASEKEEKTDQEDTFVIALPVFSYLEDETAKNKINKIMEKELGVKIDINDRKWRTSGYSGKSVQYVCRGSCAWGSFGTYRFAGKRGKGNS